MSGENEQIEEEKKADGGKIKIPAHLVAAKQAPVAKPAWMQRLASTKQLGGNKQHPAPEVTADNDAANEDNAELTSTRRRTYKVKNIHTVIPTSTSTETEIKETSDPSPPTEPTPPPKVESTENEPSSSYQSQSQLQSQPPESRKSDILDKRASLKEEAQSQSEPEREELVLNSSGSSSQEVYEDKTDDGSGTEEEVTLTENDDDNSGEDIVVESSGSASSGDTPVEKSSPVVLTPTQLPVDPDGATPQLAVVAAPTGYSMEEPLAASNVSTSTPLQRTSTGTQKPRPSRMASVYAPGIGTPSRVVHEPVSAPVEPIPSPLVTIVPRRPSGATDDDDDDFDLVPHKRLTLVPVQETSGSNPDTLTLPRRPSLAQKAETPPSSPPRATPTEPQKAALDQGVAEDGASDDRYNEDDDDTDQDNEDLDDWKFPHRHEDDSSWVNPSHPIQPERKQQVTEELKKKSVDLFPENGQVSQRLANLKSIDEEVNLNDFDYDPKVGFIIDPHGRGGDGQTISETSFSEVSKMDSSAKIIETAVPKKDMDVWAMPSQEGTYRAIGKLDTHKDGKDYRFSYIAQPHTHSTASYADVVRERYFPQENNDYWAAPAREAPPELPIHISREGRVKSGPSDENESWMPPENDPNEPPVDRNKFYTPSLADERYSEARSVVSEGSDWIGRGAMSARVDFAGSVSDNNLDSFEWNPPKEPSLSPDQEQGTQHQHDDDSHEETESEDNDDELAIEPSSATPRPPSPPAVLQGKRASESAPQDKAAAAEANSKYDYSKSGRLKFDLTPKMIMIEGNPEKGKSRSTGPGGSDPKDPGRFRCYMYLLLFALVLLGGLACIVIFVVDPFDLNEETAPASPGSMPTMEPTSSGEGDDGPTKAPSPTATFFPGPAQNPSTPTSSIDEEELLKFLSAISSDNGEALKDPTSPQYAAMQWLLTSDNIGVYKDSTLIQRYALATLYYATGGEQWLDSSLWLTDVSECDWYSSSDMGSICDMDENLLELNLRGNSLTGSLPPELNLLSNSLTTLHLGDNKISGQIPSELSDLWNLETLQLSQNQFRGTIPTLIGTMSSLKTLFLFQNSLRSSIPIQLGELTRLRELDLGANRLTGGIPTELGALKDLISLSLYGNDLSGSIPSQLSTLTNLRVLYLDSNNLGPSLPESICRDLSLDEFWSDCDEIGGCECCTKCCQDGEPCA